MIGSKRRSASTQAVSRKDEGTEPRNTQTRKDDAFNNGGSQHEHSRKGEEVLASSGSETMACVTSRLYGNPGGPVTAFQKQTGEYAEQPQKGREAKGWQGVGSSNSTREGVQYRLRESPRGVVCATRRQHSVECIIRLVTETSDIVIVNKPISKERLEEMAADTFGDMVKGVVDIKLRLLALGGGLHSDEEAALVERTHHNNSVGRCQA